MPRYLFLLAGAMAAALSVPAARAVTIETVPVGNAGNPADTRYVASGVGGVNYAYRIGKYEVTAGQYCEFLNAVAATDAYGLYNTEMWTSEYGCKIRRTGSPGSYKYSVAADRANRPVSDVSWGDAARFCNWLHNGQPTGVQDASTTEDGAYRLNGATSAFDLSIVARQVDWKWAIPTEDEWYKAAYHKNDGPTGNYFDYPTGSDTPPSNVLADPDPGNSANFSGSVHPDPEYFALGSPYYRTEVGAFENSSSPYGTFDQGGNVWEWNETVLQHYTHGIRGGAYSASVIRLQASYSVYYGSFPPTEYDIIGFRVVTIPEPGAVLTIVTGVLFCLLCWRVRSH